MASRQSPQPFCTALKMSRWRNFKGPVEMKLRRRAFLAGPNASGKSNILDALRFLRDVASDGLQKAVQQRGGMGEIRTLQATQPPGIELGIDVGTDAEPEIWSYRLKFRNHPKKHRPDIMEEEVYRHRKRILRRPDKEDGRDPDRLTQTHLEQTAANHKFRDLNRFLQSVRYLHIVPHLVRDPERYAGGRGDPFGADFLETIASVPGKSRTSRLRRINKALEVAVPQFKSLDLQQDKSGRWHLEARFGHWRSKAAKQYERAFSDGTLRLVGLLWSLAEGGGPLLLEEPELSLHGALVRRLPIIMAQMHRKSGRQALISTHSSALFKDIKEIALDEVHILVPTDQGTKVHVGTNYPKIREILEQGATEKGNMTLGDIISSTTAPEKADQFSFDF